MTLEEAQAEIIRLQEQNAQLTTERDNYSNRVNELTRENESVRELNQQYFLKLSAQYKPTPEDPEEEPEEEVLSCEDFALTLTI